MYVGCIALLEYRNYRTLTYTPARRFNLLTGPNGQGKTNLLEALGFLITGRSFRTFRAAELPCWGADQARVTGEVGRTDAAGESRRSIRRQVGRASDGAWQTTGDGCAWARAIAFGWQDLEIVHGPPAVRRNFVDGVAGRLSPVHLSTLGRFRQVLARRNRLLQEAGGAGEIGARLAPWDEQLAAVGMELVGRRRRAVAGLQAELSRVFGALTGSGESRAKVEVRYRSALGESEEPGAMLVALERARREEIRRRVTLVGPHRDDLAIEIDGVDTRLFASRGQQRLVALALRLAEVLPVTEAAGTPPVLLLDDALSELDPGVRERVLREARSAEQVFLTTPDPLAVDGAAVFHVNRGGLSPA